jgi:Nitroreductase
MNEVLKAIAARYSCRDFDGVMPEEAKLQAIAQAAVAAPSSRNRQPWRVILLENKQLLDEMEAEGIAAIRAMPDKSLHERVMSRGGTVFYHAPCMVLLAIDPTERAEALLDCGIVCQTIALAATSLGIDNLICGMARLAFAGEKAEYFKEKLGFPPEFEFGGAILLGHAATVTMPHTPDTGKISRVK